MKNDELIKRVIIMSVTFSVLFFCFLIFFFAYRIDSMMADYIDHMWLSFSFSLSENTKESINF